MNRLPTSVSHYRRCVIAALVTLTIPLTGCEREIVQPIEYDDEFRMTGFYSPEGDSRFSHPNTIDAPYTEEGVRFRFTVLRTDSSSEAKCQAVMKSGTALDGLDFVSRRDTLTFRKGEFHTHLLLTTLDDALSEPTETFRILLSSLDPAHAVATPELLVSVVDNEPPEKSGSIHFPLKVGNWWRYHGFGWVESGALAGSRGPISLDRTAVVVGEHVEGQSTYAIVEIRDEENRRGESRQEVWLQVGQQIQQTLLDPRYPWDGAVRASLPWLALDFDARSGVTWTSFSADTTLSEDEETRRYQVSKSSRGRIAIVTPLGPFFDVHATESRSEYSQVSQHFLWKSNERRVTFVADSVGIVRVREFIDRSDTFDFYSRYMEFQLVDYGRGPIPE